MKILSKGDRNLRLILLVNLIFLIGISFFSSIFILDTTSTPKKRQNYTNFPQGADFPYDNFTTINGEFIVSEDGNQYNYDVCQVGNGAIIITWDDSRSSGNGVDIYAQFIDSTGTFLWDANGSVICNAAGDQQFPKICPDGDGGAIIVWSDVTDDDNFYAQRVTSGGIHLWTLGGKLVADTPGVTSDMELVSDGKGGAFFVWRENIVNPDIYAQHINGDGDYTIDADGIEICTADYEQIRPKIILSQIGEIIIVWMDSRSFTSWDVYASKLTDLAALPWGSNGTLISNATNYQTDPIIISDANNGAIILWTDDRDSATTKKDIYAQRISSGGITAWTLNGTAICTSMQDQTTSFDNCKIAPVSSGGILCIWEDLRDDVVSDTDIYGQYLSLNGVPQWDLNGTLLVNSTDADIEISLTNSSNSEFYFSWLNEGNEFVYMNKITLDGTMNEFYTVTSDYSKQDFKILCHSTGFPILFWTGLEFGGDYNIWCKNILSNSPEASLIEDFSTSILEVGTLDWVISSNVSGGYFRINSSYESENDQVWVNWTQWTANEGFSVPINASWPGNYTYNLEYLDSENFLWGMPGQVKVEIIDIDPTISHPNDINTSIWENAMIEWEISDDFGGSDYRVLMNNSNGNNEVWKDWQPWTNATTIYIPLDRVSAGNFNYTIEFNTITGQTGSDSVIVFVSDDPDVLLEILGLQDPDTSELGTKDYILYGIAGLAVLLGLISLLTRMNKKKIIKIMEAQNQKGSKPNLITKSDKKK